MDNQQVILEEVLDENYVPTEDEIKDYAQVIGIDIDNEPDLLYIAKEGIITPLPSFWKPCQDTSGDIYYFNFQTGESKWEHPCDEYYQKRVADERLKLSKESSSKKHNRNNNNHVKRTDSGSDKSKLPSPTRGVPQKAHADVIRNENHTNFSKSFGNIIALADSDDEDNFRHTTDFQNTPKEYEETETESDEVLVNGFLSGRSSKKAVSSTDSNSEDASDYKKEPEFFIDKDISNRLDQEMYQQQNDFESTVESLRQSGNTLARSSDLDTTSPRKPFGKSLEPLTTPRSQVLVNGNVNGKHKNRKARRGSDEDNQTTALSSRAEKSLEELHRKTFREIDDKKLELLEEKEEAIQKIRLDIEREIETERKQIMIAKDRKIEELRKLAQAEFDKTEANLKSDHLVKEGEIKDRYNKGRFELEDKLKAENEDYVKKLKEEVDSIQKDERERLEYEKEKLLSKIRSELMLTEERERKKVEKENERRLSAFRKELDEKLEDECEQIEKRHAYRIECKRQELEESFNKEMEQVIDEIDKKQKELKRKRESELRQSQDNLKVLQDMEKSMDQILNEKRKEIKDRQDKELNDLKERHENLVSGLKKELLERENKEKEFSQMQLSLKKAQAQEEMESEVRALRDRGHSRLQEAKKEYDAALKEIEEKKRQTEKARTEIKKLEEELKQEEKACRAKLMALEDSKNSVITSRSEIAAEVRKLKDERDALRREIDRLKGHVREPKSFSSNEDQPREVDRPALKLDEIFSNLSEFQSAEIDDPNSDLLGDEFILRPPSRQKSNDVISRAKAFLKKQLAEKGFPQNSGTSTSASPASPRKKRRSKLAPPSNGMMNGDDAGSDPHSETRSSRRRRNKLKSKSMPSLSVTDSEDSTTTSSIEFSDHGAHRTGLNSSAPHPGVTEQPRTLTNGMDPTIFSSLSRINTDLGKVMGILHQPAPSPASTNSSNPFLKQPRHLIDWQKLTAPAHPVEHSMDRKWRQYFPAAERRPHAGSVKMPLPPSTEDKLAQHRAWLSKFQRDNGLPPTGVRPVPPPRASPRGVSTPQLSFDSQNRLHVSAKP